MSVTKSVGISLLVFVGSLLLAFGLRKHQISANDDVEYASTQEIATKAAFFSKNGEIKSFAVSSNGQFIVFQDTSTNLPISQFYDPDLPEQFYIHDRNTGEVKFAVSLPENQSVRRVSDDGRYLFLSNRQSYDRLTGAAVAVNFDDFFHYNTASSQNGDWLANGISWDEYRCELQVWSTKVAMLESSIYFDDCYELLPIQVSDNGRYVSVYFEGTVSNPSEIIYADLLTGEVVTVPDSYPIVMSGDGQTLLYTTPSTNNANGPALEILNVETGETIKVPDSEGAEAIVNPDIFTLSPNGNWVHFLAYQSFPYPAPDELRSAFRYRVGDATSEKLIEDSTGIERMRILNDGTVLGYLAEQAEIYSYSPGRPGVPLAMTVSDEPAAIPDNATHLDSMSPDGRYITVRSDASNLVDDQLPAVPSHGYLVDTITNQNFRFPILTDTEAVVVHSDVSNDGIVVATYAYGYESDFGLDATSLSLYLLQPETDSMTLIAEAQLDGDLWRILSWAREHPGRYGLGRISADGSTVVMYQNGVTAYDVETQTSEQLTGGWPRSISADGMRVTYTYDGECYLYDRATDTEILLPAPIEDVNCAYPQVAAEGDRVVFTEQRKEVISSLREDYYQGVYVYDLETDELIELAAYGLKHFRWVPTISANGQLVTTYVNGQRGIIEIDTMEFEPIDFRSDPYGRFGHILAPTFMSTDQRYVTFESYGPNQSYVHRHSYSLVYLRDRRAFEIQSKLILPIIAR